MKRTDRIAELERELAEPIEDVIAQAEQQAEDELRPPLPRLFPPGESQWETK